MKEKDNMESWLNRYARKRESDAVRSDDIRLDLFCAGVLGKVWRFDFIFMGDIVCWKK